MESEQEKKKKKMKNKTMAKVAHTTRRHHGHKSDARHLYSNRINVNYDYI